MNQESPGFSRGEQVNDESLLAATSAALDAAALMDEERANCPR